MAYSSVDPGKLRHRLSLEFQNEQPDGSGGFETDWKLVADVWGAIEPVTISRQMEVGTENPQIAHKITIRWRDDCLPQMRFTKSGRVFLINTVFDPDETKRYLICSCEELI
ncbi:MAG: phage head closure protein [Rhizobiaceae bacterium]|nr:phage head closure protein [Rhizobiaceae bacterium]